MTAAIVPTPLALCPTEYVMRISSMFELVEKLDFDYIMNSQALWGCFDTVRGLRIAELLRPQNSKTVTVIRYTWNGRERVLDAQ